MQFQAKVTAGDVRAIRLTVDIEAWGATPQVTTAPGNVGYHVLVEADPGSGFATVADLGVMTIDTIVPPPPAVGRELWKTDGSQTSLVADITPGSNGSGPNSNMVVFHDQLYFVARRNTLYRFDGTTVVEVAKLGEDGTYSRLWVVNDTLIADVTGFDIDQGAGQDMFLRIDDGGITRIPNEQRLERLEEAAVFNNSLYFSGEPSIPSFGRFTPDIGRELWKFDVEAVSLVADINPRLVPSDIPEASSQPRDFTVFNNELYFVAGPVHENEGELFKVDGDGVTQVADIFPFTDQYLFWGTGAREPIVFNGAIFFIADDDVTGQELWKFDGTQAVRVADIRPGRAGLWVTTGNL